MDWIKKVFHFLSTILFYSIILILGITFFMVIVTFVDKKFSTKNGKVGSPLFGAYVIISESMVPHINVYDAVVTIRAKEKQIQIDDIITFLSKEIETAGTPITHRVIGIVHDPNDQNKIIGYRTKGDHNNTADFALIAPNEVIGKVFLRIPMIGYLQLIMTKPIGWLFIIVIPCLLIIASDIFKLFKNSKLKEREENVISEKSNMIVSSDSDKDIKEFNYDLYHRLEPNSDLVPNQINNASTQQNAVFSVGSENVYLSNQVVQQNNINQSVSSLAIDSKSDDDNII